MLGQSERVTLPYLSRTEYSQVRRWIFCLLIFIAVCLVYLPVWRAGFIWDDDQVLLENPLIHQSNGWYKIWFRTDFPLALSSFWLEWRLWGANPLGYHLVNVALHAVSAVLWWRVLTRLKVPGAAFAAALFAVHPVNVESVAWISERKNTLSMVFYVMVFLWHLRFEETGRLRWYWLALASFALALLSKTAAAPLPLVLLGLAWWRRGRLEPRDIRTSLPFFGLAVATALMSVWFQSHQAIGSDSIIVRSDSLWARLAGAGWAVWFYLYKAILPLNLAFVYPRWIVDASHPFSYAPTCLLATALLFCLLCRRPWGRSLFVGFGYFVLLLLPILGFVPIYFMRYSLVADHWQYFAIIGPITLLATGLVHFFTRYSRMPAWIRPALGSGLVLVVGVLAWAQVRTYADIETLWRETLARNPKASIAHWGLGNLLLKNGNTTEAIAHYRKALVLQPGADDVLSNLGAALLSQGQVTEAISDLEEALRIRPDSVFAHNNLGNALLQEGQVAEALVHFQKAVEIHPDAAATHVNLANALLRMGRTGEAIEQLQRSLEIQPGLAEVHDSLGCALLQAGRTDEAITQLQQAVALRPELASIHRNLGIALLEKGRLDEAAAHFRKALALQPNDGATHGSLGTALVRQGQLEAASAEFELALKLNPDQSEPHYNLANLFLAQGRLPQAIAHYQEAIALQPHFAAAHNNLGNALLSLGELDEAIFHLREALRLRPDLIEAHNNLATALFQKGHASEAIAEYQSALAVQPANPALLNNLAWALATFPEASVRNGGRAVELAQQADRLSGGKNPLILGTLAAAYAEANRFPEAVAAAQQAIEFATAQSNPAQVELLRSRLALYQAGSPFRDQDLLPRRK